MLTNLQGYQTIMPNEFHAFIWLPLCILIMWINWFVLVGAYWVICLDQGITCIQSLAHYYFQLSSSFFFVFYIVSNLDVRFAFSSAAVRAEEEQTMMNALAMKMTDGLEVM